jgi:hypothetical protein
MCWLDLSYTLAAPTAAAGNDQKRGKATAATGKAASTSWHSAPSMILLLRITTARLQLSMTVVTHLPQTAMMAQHLCSHSISFLPAATAL